MGDGTAHGGKIVIGNPTVLIGDSGATIEKSKAAKVEVPEFDLDEVLANPELGAIRAVNIDPASMLVDDMVSLSEEGQEFINNPTLLVLRRWLLLRYQVNLRRKLSMNCR